MQLPAVNNRAYRHRNTGKSQIYGTTTLTTLRGHGSA